ncbi:MAG: 30S ribosomal protein S4e [Candidatus Bathyarchaeia archaeon]
MGGKGGSKHLKRLPAPTFWPIHVKESSWVTKPRPGPHSVTRSIPLSIVLRDILHYAKTSREAKMIIAKGAVKVDGRVRRDSKYPVGLMDVLEIPEARSTFRMVPFPRKGLSLLKITKDEGGFKLCLIQDRKYVGKDRIQLNLSDGRNITLSQEEASRGAAYAVRDTVQIGIPSQKILGHIRFTEGKYGLVVAGRNVGRHGRILEISKAAASLGTVTIQDAQGGTFRTVSEYVYAVGDERPIIKLPGDQ